MSSDWRRANARSRCVRAAARYAEADAASMKRGISSGRLACHAPAHEIERADDAGQQIIEVVRDAAREMADGLHLLRLPKGFLRGGELDFRLALGRDVATGAIDKAVFRNADPGNPTVAAVLAAIAVDETERRLADLASARSRPACVPRSSGCSNSKIDMLATSASDHPRTVCHAGLDVSKYPLVFRAPSRSGLNCQVRPRAWARSITSPFELARSTRGGGLPRPEAPLPWRAAR